MNKVNASYLYEKCMDCLLPASAEKKQLCALHWRPGSGTKKGFPRPDGWECPKDSFKELAKDPTIVKIFRMMNEKGREE